MFNKKYLIDGNEASANDIIKLASKLDEKYNNDWLKQTSVATNILRENGYIIENNLAINNKK